MFVLDDRRYNDNPEALTRQVRSLLEKNRGTILNCEKWDDRRLAYPIHGRHRGVYLLTRFTAPPGAIRNMERECQLNDNILRVLFTRDEHSEKLHKAGLLDVGDEDAAEPAQPAEEPAPPPEAPAEGPGPAGEPAQADAPPPESGAAPAGEASPETPPEDQAQPRNEPNAE
jgi:small subunit ribosomal protein S6